MPPFSPRSPAAATHSHFPAGSSDIKPGKSLYTTVREFVENGLDAAEDARVLPEIVVRIDRVPDHAIGDLYGHKVGVTSWEGRQIRRAGEPCIRTELTSK